IIKVCSLLAANPLLQLRSAKNSKPVAVIRDASEKNAINNLKTINKNSACIVNDLASNNKQGF
ncbi:hypothetical protein, partial [Streptomyces scabiei]|uniref:hypothetical protein n=1 Tax=Streptomyces scabiei TaxID=1930 RepID=UPI0038F74B7E